MKPIFRTLIVKADTGQDGTTTVIASTPTADRMDDICAPDWQIERFMANPICAWSHDYSIPPVGKVIGLTLEGDTLVARIKWDDSDANPLGQTVAHQYREGFMSAVSVGFAPGKSTPRNQFKRDDPRFAERGTVFTENELLEISAVAIPANAECVAIRAKSWGMAAAPVQKHVLDVIDTDDTVTITLSKRESEAPDETPDEAPAEAEEQLGLWDDDTDEHVTEGITADDLTARVRAAVLDLFGSDPAVQAAVDPPTDSTPIQCGLSALFELDPTPSALAGASYCTNGPGPGDDNV